MLKGRMLSRSLPPTAGRVRQVADGAERSCEVADSQYAVVLQLGDCAGGAQHLTVKINNLRNITRNLGPGGRFFETAFIWLRIKTNGELL